MVLGLCGLLTTTACATMKEVEKAAEKEVKKEVTAVKKGEVGSIGGAALSVAIQKKISDDATLKGSNIDVEVKDNNTVHLKGSASAEQKEHAEKVVKDIPGVTKVVNEIKASGAKTAAKGDDKGADNKGAAKDSKDSKDSKDLKPARK
jgi:osmotically-inducible protein OsmY